MTTTITISKTLSIRDCGYDENSLQDQIADAPSILGLGDLEFVRREKKQSSGGRLDILLKDSGDDSMYEVEVMLGATDESHIIRTIEYRARGKDAGNNASILRCWLPRASPGAFFDVVQLLSLSIPIIAIQANMIEAKGARVLHFTKILDTYEEPEDEAQASAEPCDESWWRSQSEHTASTLAAAEALYKIVSPVYDRIDLAYTVSYISLKSGYIQFRLMRSRGKSLVRFYVNDSDVDAVLHAFNKKGSSPLTTRSVGEMVRQGSG